MKNYKNLYLLILLLWSSFLSGCGWLFGGRNFSYSSPSGVTFSCAEESSEITIDPKLAETALKYSELIAQQKIAKNQIQNRTQLQIHSQAQRQNQPQDPQYSINFLLPTEKDIEVMIEDIPALQEIIKKDAPLSATNFNLMKQFMKEKETFEQLEKYMLTPEDAMKKCDDFLTLFHRMRNNN